MPRSKDQNNHLLLANLSAVLFMTNLNISIICVALPELAKTFMVDASAIPHILLSCLLAIVGLLACFALLATVTGLSGYFRQEWHCLPLPPCSAQFRPA